MNMIPSQDQKYDFKPRWSAIALTILFFGLISAIPLAVAPSNKVEAVVLWAVGLSGLGLVLFALLMAVRRLVDSQPLILTPSAIVVPRYLWWCRPIRIPYACITGMSETEPKSFLSRFLYIYHVEGTTWDFRAMLPAAGAYEAIRDMVAELLASPFGAPRGNGG